jgi:sec-independent protein translocase protein TatC
MSYSDKIHQNQNDFSKAPLIDHLIELRSRLIRSIFIFFIGFVISFYFSTSIYSFLVNPFFDIAGSSGEMIYTAPQEFLVTKLKIGIFGASLIGLPYFAIELYLFLAPGLYENEKMALIPYFIATPFLFLISTLMVHYLIMPLALNFFISMQINSNFDNISIKLLPRVSEYLKLVTSLIIAFGICFQLPVVLTLLAKIGIVGSENLKKGRKYAIVLTFLVAAFLTPPDLISQIGLAIPTLLLYELSILLVSLIERKNKKGNISKN